MKYSQDKENMMIEAMGKSKLNEAELTAAMQKALQVLPVTVWEVDDNGARKYAKTLGGRTEDLNNRNSMFGNG